MSICPVPQLSSKSMKLGTISAGGKLAYHVGRVPSPSTENTRGGGPHLLSQLSGGANVQGHLHINGEGIYLWCVHTCVPTETKSVIRSHEVAVRSVCKLRDLGAGNSAPVFNRAA